MRRDLIELILANPGISIGDTCAHFKVSRFTVMRHLNVLEGAQLLFRERRGALKHLYIDREALAELGSGWLRNVVAAEEPS